MMKKLALVGISLLVALMLAGCVDFSALQQSAATDSEDPEATPMPPLSEPMYEDLGALYKYYNEVSLSDTLTTLTERYGEPAVEKLESGSVYTWVMEDGYGFAAAFFDGGRLRGKVLYYADIRQLGRLSSAPKVSGVFDLTTDYPLTAVKSALGGTAMEISKIAQDQSVNPTVNTLYVWANEQGDVAQILFDEEDKLESINYSLAEGQ